VNHAVRKSADLTGTTGVAVNENAKTRFEREEGQKKSRKNGGINDIGNLAMPERLNAT